MLCRFKMYFNIEVVIIQSGVVQYDYRIFFKFKPSVLLKILIVSHSLILLFETWNNIRNNYYNIIFIVQHYLAILSVIAIPNWKVWFDEEK